MAVGQKVGQGCKSMPVRLSPPWRRSHSRQNVAAVIVIGSVGVTDRCYGERLRLTPERAESAREIIARAEKAFREIDGGVISAATRAVFYQRLGIVSGYLRAVMTVQNERVAASAGVIDASVRESSFAPSQRGFHAIAHRHSPSRMSSIGFPAGTAFSLIGTSVRSCRSYAVAFCATPNRPDASAAEKRSVLKGRLTV